MDESLPIENVAQPQPLPAPRPRVLLPVLLFIATCVSTWHVGGPAFSIPVMIILLSHELGHFLQALRYRVPASLPYFIPIPQSPIGTMGAVIVMRPGMGDRRSLFDIGISGPLAGIVPAMIFSIVGLHFSNFVALSPSMSGLQLGEPLVFKFLAYLIMGPTPPGAEIVIHPMAYAGWVGIFITALNLVPIGQLDGGHVLYAILRDKAHGVARGLLLAAMFAVVVWGYWGWSLMILLLMLMGPIHPPTSNDELPLGTGRTILGWASLLFVPLGFTPVPFSLPT